MHVALAELLPRDLPVRLVHLAWGIATIGLVEAAAARQRRAQRVRSAG
ncbi:MAG: hypothetical protein HY690_10600 [Chloroflexi bacterium]|nr:hypothetical protein [Chloroflexota bacterium]